MKIEYILIAAAALALFVAVLRHRGPPRKRVISAPTLGILNLEGSAAEALVVGDRAAIAPFFSQVEAGTAAPPRCDVLLLYARLGEDGRVANSTLSLRELVRDSGAVIVVVASENSAPGITAATRRTGYGHANLAVTLQRKGSAFSNFYQRLFAAMAQGVTMPVAWNNLAPQVPGLDHADCPSGFFACEAGQIAFK